MGYLLGIAAYVWLLFVFAVWGIAVAAIVGFSMLAVTLLAFCEAGRSKRPATRRAEEE